MTTHPLLKLHCNNCKQTIEGLTILLPEHIQSEQGIVFKNSYESRCVGSGRLARFFVDSCPVCEVHGRKPDCPTCKGSGQVLTPIKYQLQMRTDLHDDPKDDVWIDVSEQRAREAMPPHWDQDDCISFLYSDPGETADYGLMSLRVKPGINRPEPIKQDPEQIVTTSQYWDCECKTNYIHSKAQSECSLCGASKEDQPDSRMNEVLQAGLKIDESEQDPEPITDASAKPVFFYTGVDDWSRGLYKSKKTGAIYVDVDGRLYSRTDWGEPNIPIRELSSVEIVKE